MLKEITPVADALVVTEFKIGTDTMISNASYEAKTLKSLLQQSKSYKGSLFLENDSVKAVKKAIAITDTNTVIGITGSLYLIGELKQNATFLE
jgi:folylpolyglutamate synthase/dihydropteroate synthase